MLSVIMLSVIRLSVIMLSAMAPCKSDLLTELLGTILDWYNKPFNHLPLEYIPSLILYVLAKLRVEH